MSSLGGKLSAGYAQQIFDFFCEAVLTKKAMRIIDAVGSLSSDFVKRICRRLEEKRSSAVGR